MENQLADSQKEYREQLKTWFLKGGEFLNPTLYLEFNYTEYELVDFSTEDTICFKFFRIWKMGEQWTLSCDSEFRLRVPAFLKNNPFILLLKDYLITVTSSILNSLFSKSASITYPTKPVLPKASDYKSGLGYSFANEIEIAFANFVSEVGHGIR